MRKIICLIALAAISFGSVVAAPVIGMQRDTAKTKVKHKGTKVKIKKKQTVADSTKNM